MLRERESAAHCLSPRSGRVLLTRSKAAWIDRRELWRAAHWLPPGSYCMSSLSLSLPPPSLALSLALSLSGVQTSKGKKLLFCVSEILNQCDWKKSHTLMQAPPPNKTEGRQWNQKPHGYSVFCSEPRVHTANQGCTWVRSAARSIRISARAGGRMAQECG